MADTTNALITSANRGIGKALLATYLSRPNNTAIASVHTPTHFTSVSLSTLPVGTNSRLSLLTLDSTSPTDAQDAIASLQSTHGIKHLDVVIANAGLCTFNGKVKDIPAATMHEHLTTNTIGPLLLFQATLPLLLSPLSPNPKFVSISSAAGCIEYQPYLPFDLTPYRASKAASNLLVRKIHVEHEKLVSFAVHPGWLKTEMGNWAAEKSGVESGEAPMGVEEGVEGVVKVIDEASRESTSGRFWKYDGTVIPW